MAKKTKTANPAIVNTAVTNSNSALNGITLPVPGSQETKKEPKLQTCEVGPFRLPGVRLDLEQFTDQELAEMDTWAKENGAYLGHGLYSWKDAAKRDWFILRWS